MARSYTRRLSTGSPIETKHNRARAEMEDEEVVFFDGTSGGFPPVPQIPGFHCAWIRISTTAVPDGSAIRQYVKGLGYEIVSPDEVPDFDEAYATGSLANHGHDGPVIQHRDTVYCKVPMKRFLAIQRGMQEQANAKRRELYQLPDDKPRGMKVSEHIHSDKPFLLKERTVALGTEE